MTVVLLSMTVFIALSGLMAAIDAALLSVTLPEVHESVAQKKRGAKTLKQLKSELTRAVVVVVILTNVINVLGPILVSQHAIAAFGPKALGVVTIALACGTIVFSEIVPKAVGTRFAPVISRYAAFPIRVLQTLLYPLIVIFEAVSRLFTSGSREIGTEEQIRSLTAIGRRAGLIEGDESRMIHKAFVLNDRHAVDIMTPLDQVVYVSVNQTIAEAASDVVPSRFSRFPVFGTSPDDVIGVVMVRDILQHVVDDNRRQSIQTITRDALIVDAKTRSDSLLLMFRRQHMHLAVVIDGTKTVGVVTLENVLEELVGEIEDERDSDAQLRNDSSTQCDSC